MRSVILLEPSGLQTWVTHGAGTRGFWSTTPSLQEVCRAYHLYREVSLMANSAFCVCGSIPRRLSRFCHVETTDGKAEESGLNIGFLSWCLVSSRAADSAGWLTL
jgi:hypothetical protein